MSWIHKIEGKEWFVYVIGEDELQAGCVKIGTARNVSYRLAGLQGGNWRRLIVHAVARTSSRDSALSVERDAHLHFGHQRLPGRDWVYCTPDDAIAFLNTHPLVKGISYGAD